MVGRKAVVGLWIAALLLVIDCGGRAISDSPSTTTGDPAVNGGAANAADAADAADECVGGATDGGCGGEAGDPALEQYARLRATCGRSVEVNRRGAPVPISLCIH